MSLFKNIHKMAARLIPMERIRWRKANGRTISDAGIPTTAYGEWIKVRAHVQPGRVTSSLGGSNQSETNYEDMGMDFSRRLWTVWVSGADVQTICGVDSTDQVEIHGKVCNIINISDWAEFDGWKRAVVEQVIDN